MSFNINKETTADTTEVHAIKTRERSLFSRTKVRMVKLWKNNAILA